MSVGHYENFPVASLLVPRALRRPIAAIYRFARAADDFADEGNDPPGRRLERLGAFRDELDRIAGGRAPQGAAFAELAEVARAHALPLQPFYDLLEAFSQDVVKRRYADFAEVLEYCRRSANPVGRLLLHLFGRTEPEALERSDRICTALQLVNFWQDVDLDFRDRDRIYLPREDMARFGVTEAQLGERCCDAAFRGLLAFQVERARRLMLEGKPLVRQLAGRVRLEIALTVQGGLRILEKIERAGFDVFRRRPVLGPLDWPLLGARALLRP